MKRLFLLLALVGIIATSCEESGIEEPSNPIEQPAEDSNNDNVNDEENKEDDNVNDEEIRMMTHPYMARVLT